MLGRIRKVLKYCFVVLFLHASMFVDAQTFVKPDNAEIKFTGAFFNKISDTEVIFRRHSDAFLALTDWNEALAGDDNAKTTTGVTINFTTDASKIDLHLRMLPGKNTWKLYASYYIDGDSIGVLSQKRDDLASAGDSSFVFTVSSPSAGKHSYRFVLGTYNTVEFKGLTLTGNSESPEETVLPDKPVYVAYGNSITHGQGQNTGDQTYPWALAAKMGWQLYNIAVGGSKTSVPMAEMLKNEVSDTIDYMTILIGYNDAIGSAKDTSYYREKLISFIDTVRKGHPETTIFVLGQTFTIATENKNGDPVNFDDWRKVQKYVVDSLTSAGDSSIHYLNGEELTNYSSLNNPPKDPVHLSVDGAYLFGNALADTIKHLLKKPNAIFTPTAHRKNISVYPNPTSGKITVSTNDNTSGTVEIFTVTGEKVMTFRNEFRHSGKITIDISKLPRGLYFLKAGNGIKKIVKY